MRAGRVLQADTRTAKSLPRSMDRVRFDVLQKLLEASLQKVPDQLPPSGSYTAVGCAQTQTEHIMQHLSYKHAAQSASVQNNEQNSAV